MTPTASDQRRRSYASSSDTCQNTHHVVFCKQIHSASGQMHLAVDFTALFHFPPWFVFPQGNSGWVCRFIDCQKYKHYQLVVFVVCCTRFKLLPLCPASFIGSNSPSCVRTCAVNCITFVLLHLILWEWMPFISIKACPPFKLPTILLVHCPSVLQTKSSSELQPVFSNIHWGSHLPSGVITPGLWLPRTIKSVQRHAPPHLARATFSQRLTTLKQKQLS